MIISQTPLRISLAGGGTDLPSFYRQRRGRVLSAAIDKYVYVIITKRYDDQIYVGYTQKEIVSNASDVKHELVREALLQTGFDQGIEITMLADIPAAGSGLGSSSSLTVGLLNALYTMRGSQISAEQLAREACEIEIERCGKPIGKQDQYIAAFGGVCVIDFNPDDSVVVSKQELTDKQLWYLSQEFLLFYTAVTRQSADILARQSSNTPSRLAHLDELLSMVDEATEAVHDADYTRIGKLLRRNWDIKRKLADGITNPAIDSLVARATRAGMTGGKIAGAGGGGFLLACCPMGKQTALRQELAEYRECPFTIDPYGSRIIFNQTQQSWR